MRVSQNYFNATLPFLLRQYTLAAWQFQRYALATLLIVVRVGDIYRIQILQIRGYGLRMHSLLVPFALSTASERSTSLME